MVALQLIIEAAGLVAPWLAWYAGRRSRRAAWAVVLPLVLLSSIWFILSGRLAGSRIPLGIVRPGVVESQWLLPSADLDINVLRGGIDAAPRLRDTAGWWAGRWIGQNEFWRPLSSYLFWGEWRAFGPNGWWWAAVSVAMAVALAAVTFWALFPILDEGAAAVAVIATFVGMWTPWDRVVPMGPVVGLWKNQPDLLAGLGILAAVGWAVRGRLGLATAASCFAVACKELGFTAFLLVPLALAWMQRVRGVPCNWRRVVRYLGPAALALAAWHLHVVGVGHRVGGNVSWPLRALVYYGGFPVSQWRGGVVWVALLGAACGLWLPRLLKRPLLALAMLVAGVGAAAFLVAWDMREPLDVAVTIVLLGWDQVATAAAWAWAARQGYLRQAPTLALGGAWMLIGAAPTFAATQVQMHARWLGSLGQGIIAAGVVAAVCEWALEQRWCGMKGSSRPADASCLDVPADS